MNAITRSILLAHVHSVSVTGRPRILDTSYVLERISFVLRTGCQWSYLPVQNGSWKTVYHYFALWSKQHVFERAFHDMIQFYVRRRGLSHNLITDTSLWEEIV